MHIEQFSMEALPHWYPMRAFKRRLVNAAGCVRAIVNGDEIAGEFLLSGYSLIITSYDYFDGVSTWFYLIDPSGKIIDNVSTTDYFGFIQDVNIPGVRTLHFGFFGTDDRWELIVHPAGFWSFRFPELARRINRFIWRKRYISLKRMQS
jgi:hypothetical protein